MRSFLIAMIAVASVTLVTVSAQASVHSKPATSTKFSRHRFATRQRESAAAATRTKTTATNGPISSVVNQLRERHTTDEARRSVFSQLRKGRSLQNLKTRTAAVAMPESLKALDGPSFERGTEKSESALLDEIMMDIKSLSSDGENLRRPSISTVFFIVLSSVALSVVSPSAFSESVTEVLIPVAASIIAVATTAAEFQGKDATADAKEVAAVALAQAARSEAYLSRAEKSKAIIPALVGVSAMSATLNLIFPAIMASGVVVNPLLIAACPIIGGISAAVSSVACIETLAQGYLALGKISGDRMVSVKEANTRQSRFKALRQRAWGLSKAVLPSILIGLFLPGDYVFKCIVASAWSAVSVAYNLAEAETVVAEVTLKVAFISKAAAKADVFANKAASEAAVLPFTSAIAGVSTALAAALVEVSPVAASFIPLFGAVASGVGASAASRSEMDATSTRLAFRDSGVSKIAPITRVPTLFGNVLPPLFQSMVKTGADTTAQSLQNLVNLAEKNGQQPSSQKNTRSNPSDISPAPAV